MAHAILMPKPGQMTEECTIIAWHKREGDPVARGDILFEIETDKSTMEVESFDDGVLLRRLVAEGDTVPVNTICAYVGRRRRSDPRGGAGRRPLPCPASPGSRSGGRAGPRHTASHLGRFGVRRPVLLRGGEPGRIPRPHQPASQPGGSRGRHRPPQHRRHRSRGTDHRARRASGHRGAARPVPVVAADAAAAPPVPRVAPAPAAAPSPAIPADGEEAPRPLSRMRRVIADRLTHSWTSTPHFTVTVAVDVTALLALRAELKAGGTNLTVTDFVLAATAQTLAEFPDVNSRTDGVSVWPRRRVHLGLAVSLPGGLVVPVIRDADRLPIAELHDRAAALAAKAREGALAVDDMTGSTFTVSNLGMFGVEEFSAIINPGEAAILAVASAIPTAVAIGDGLAVRSIMKLTLSADHRLVDGELGARFLGAIRRRLEDSLAFRQEALNA